MATELVISRDRVQKFFDDLEAQKNILSSCSQLFTTLSNRFSSQQDTVTQKSLLIESKFQALESHSRETLESLVQRENSIPERESAAAARIEEQKEVALAAFEKPASWNAELSETLKSLFRKMDASALLSFIVSKRKESASLRIEILQAIAEAVDQPRLVLDALEEFLNSKSAKAGVTDKRWACGIVIQSLFPETSSGRKPPEFSRSIVDRAARLAEYWKGQMDNDSESGAVGAAEAVMFLQMVLGFRLRERFDEEYIRNLVMEFASRRDMAKLAASLEFGEKMGDIIDELVKKGKEIEAVYFASESGLTERFPPVNLLKSYLRNSKKNAATILKNGNNSQAATDESSTVEFNSIKAIIKCVEDHKLESEFNLDSLRKRATHLEKTKADRKKSLASSSKAKKNKRAHETGGARSGHSSSFRPAKAAKFHAHPSFSRKNTGPPPRRSPVVRFSGPFNYASQTIYDAPSASPYAATYRASHAQSPAAITLQHYSLPMDNVGSAGYRPGGSFAGHGATDYGLYDYGNAAAPAYQPPFAK